VANSDITPIFELCSVGGYPFNPKKRFQSVWRQLQGTFSDSFGLAVSRFRGISR